MTYAEWRSQLHSIQLEIDAFDESYDYNKEYDHDDYTTRRKPLIDKLEAHYKLKSTCV
jgi:hypothetical protein